MNFLNKLPIFLWENFINIIYPKNCLICGKYSNEYLCKKCEAKLNKYSINEIDNYKDKYFKKHIYCFKYENKIRKLIIDYKFNDKSYLYEIFVKFLLKNKKMCRFFESYDIIIPVPIHKKRKNIRGYNQSELIARKIANTYQNLELENAVIKKQKNTVEQSKLTKEIRTLNVKNVYKVTNKQKINNKKIILFDDIYTTGATANECAKMLKQNGAKDIVVITIAKD